MEEITQPILEGYLGSMVTVFLNGAQSIEGTFAGYDYSAYYLEVNSEYVTIHRRAVEMMMPTATWEKLRAAENEAIND